MKKLSNKSESPSGEKFSQELRGQPRKSQNYAPKHVSTHAHHHQDDDRERHHHHHEPGKNAVRMQLRSIQRFF